VRPGQRLHALAQNLEQAPLPHAAFDHGFLFKALQAAIIETG
jgi:hypothetical protein